MLQGGAVVVEINITGVFDVGGAGAAIVVKNNFATADVVDACGASRA